MVRKILVAVDVEDMTLSERMLAVTSDLSRLKGADVTLMYVAANIAPNAAIQLPDDYQDQTALHVSEQLDHLLGQLNLPDGTAKVAVRFGSVYREVLAQAKEDGTDLIIIGCHKPDFADYLLGPNAARVVRHASCSVFVVR